MRRRRSRVHLVKRDIETSRRCVIATRALRAERAAEQEFLGAEDFKKMSISWSAEDLNQFCLWREYSSTLGSLTCRKAVDGFVEEEIKFPSAREPNIVEVVAARIEAGYLLRRLQKGETTISSPLQADADDRCVQEALKGL